MKRKLGKSGLEVSAMGLGCWAIGGPWTYDTVENEPHAAGWGQVDDQESIKAIHAGLDLGITFFDTAANYGAGHSERILGKALKDKREKVVIATKFGYLVDEEKKLIVRDHDAVVSNIKQDCENSLKRLDTDYIDLYQFHVGDYPPEKAGEVRDILEELVKEGKIRWYGWSTDNPEGASVFAEGEHCTAIQQAMSWAMVHDYDSVLKVCEENNLASINRGPLGMGLLTGKFQKKDSKFPEDDIRKGWDFQEGRIADIVRHVDAVKEILTSDGRSLAQGALGWLWAYSDITVPIPGFKNVAQVEENAKAMEFGPLGEEQMKQIQEIVKKEDQE